MVHVSGTLLSVPNQPREGRVHRSVSFNDVDWEAGKPVTELMETSRTQVIEELWAWYLRRPDARLPERPPLEAIEQAYEEVRQREIEIRALALTLVCPTCKTKSGPCLTTTERPRDGIHRRRLVVAGEVHAEQEKAADSR
jgi:hypothetical protein